MLKSLLKDLYSRNSVAQEAIATLAQERSEASESWLSGLVYRMFEVMHDIEKDNFDADRFRNQPANTFAYERHASYFVFLLKNAENFYNARQIFEDEPSRELYDRLILFRVMGHLHVRLPFNTPPNRALAATAQDFWVRDTEDVGPFGPLAIFRVPGTGQDIQFKGWKENVTWTFLYRQYYFARGGVEIKPAPGDRVIDGGGCFGDTALSFADAVGANGHVYVFDPMPKHCAIMRQQLAMNPALAPRISIFPAGLADRVNDVAPLPEDGVINPGARVVAAEMPITTVDEAVARNNLPSVEFIKMDIEGSELGALQGAEAAIRRWQPKLAISLYHRPEDFFSIPTWIDSLGIGYRLFLDHYTIHQEETVLYAMV